MFDVMLKENSILGKLKLERKKIIFYCENLNLKKFFIKLFFFFLLCFLFFLAEIM
jgi:hypothetical protein